MAKIELSGTIEKIVRVNEAEDAQVVITVPIEYAATLPTGKVSISIESKQGTMFSGKPGSGLRDNMHPVGGNRRTAGVK